MILNFTDYRTIETNCDLILLPPVIFSHDFNSPINQQMIGNGFTLPTLEVPDLFVVNTNDFNLVGNDLRVEIQQ